MNWTEEQKEAIYEKDSNILVAAAAGSGKTAVLVERIIHKVVDERMDIDKILVVTFTNAAASEMRERILDAIYQKLEEKPEDSHLQRQITLLNKASICTIHSFCLDVIRNHFYEIDASANFRIGDTAEIELLKNDVLEEIFEKKYEEEDKGFLKLIDTYTGYRGDEALVELVLSIYKYIQSSPYPEKWLKEKIELFDLENGKDFADTIWGKIILQEAKELIYECIMKLQKAENDTLKFAELEKYTRVLEEDINKLKYIYENGDTWDNVYKNIVEMEWEKWPVDRKVTLDIKNKVKEIRDTVKKQFSTIEVKCTSEEAIDDIQRMYCVLKELQNLVQEFSQNFARRKKEKNMIDFNDIEHFALRILLKEDNEKKIVPTEVAKKYKEKFLEIAIDEYQDSNMVQEYILNSISNGKNIFMVGDVKQSIYKFRQARPELFLEKYTSYQLKKNKAKEDNLKIQLFKNFRSRENILEITNLVFENIMSKELGNVAYTLEEYLNYGANYPTPEEKKNFAGIAELHIIDLKEEKADFYKTESDNTLNETKDEEERIENSVLEARFVANKIKELLESDYMIYDKKSGYRKVTYKDICILLRATSSLAPIYEKEMADLSLPVFSDTSSTYLDSMEVQTIMSLLKMIDNPMQDIPLVTILRSAILNFNDDELIQIRLADKNSTFYEAMLKARLVVQKELRNKIENTINQIEKWHEEEQYMALDEFIWKLYKETGFYYYVSLLTNGDLRQANLKLLFEKAKQYEKASFKGLFNFVNFIDKVKQNSNDMGAAKLIGENENVIRIMSIHKSKGLEFPIVFLCGTGKKFNMQDLNKPILLHQDIGFGPKMIDSERKIEYNTLAKEAIRIASKRETISEEMRILYVALTRAKEKLIITGLAKDLEKALEEKRQYLSIYEHHESKINSKLVEKYISYLDWLELIYIYHEGRIENIIHLEKHNKQDVLKGMQKKEKEEVNIEKLLEQKIKQIKQEDWHKEEQEKLTTLLQWEYPYQVSSQIPTKTSVTKLKQLEETADIEELIEARQVPKEQIKLTYMPSFMEKEQKLTPAQKGTLMHLCVQKLDETKDYTIKDIENFIQKLYEREIISEIEKQNVNIQVLYQYTKSKLFESLRTAKKVYKEQPFYMNIPAKTIYENAEAEEQILVQGIIDLYYIDKEDKLILVDFKTDHVKKGEERLLEEKYKLQLEIYKKALEETLGRKVEKAMIYALS